MFTNPWADHRVEQLKQLWEAGYSCSQIAGVMGEGITRNAVIGKVTRLGLPKRVNINEPRLRTTTKRKYRSKQRALARTVDYIDVVREIEEIELPPMPVDALNIKLVDSTAFQCKWIQNDDDLVCGHETIKGGSWCAYHRSIVFEKPKPRPRRNVITPKFGPAGIAA